MSKNRDSIWTMLRYADGENPNQLIDSWTHPDGLQCVVLRIRDAHYTGYVQLPEWLTGATDNGEYPHRYDIESLWKCPPYGGITYGPDKSGWVGCDFNHGPADTAYDGDGNPLPNNLWFDHELGPFEPDERHGWTPEKVRASINDWATDIGEMLWYIREGECEPQ